MKMTIPDKEVWDINIVDIPLTFEQEELKELKTNECNDIRRKGGSWAECDIPEDPTIRTAKNNPYNMWQFSVLDPLKRVLDVADYTTPELTQEFNLNEFAIWYKTADMVPNNKFEMTFSFQLSKNIPPEKCFKVIEINTAVGFKLAVDLPADVTMISKKGRGGLPVKYWSWIDPSEDPDRRQIFFILDTKAINEEGLTVDDGLFQVSFPMQAPPAEMAKNDQNIWSYKFCQDFPYCFEKNLEVWVPGWQFGDAPYRGSFGDALLEDVMAGAWRSRTPSILSSVFVLAAALCTSMWAAATGVLI